MMPLMEISVLIDFGSHHFDRNELFNRQSPHNLDGRLNASLHLKDVFETAGLA
jgi:hypothetical protein